MASCIALPIAAKAFETSGEHTGKATIQQEALAPEAFYICLSTAAEAGERCNWSGARTKLQHRAHHEDLPQPLGQSEVHKLARGCHRRQGSCRPSTSLLLYRQALHA